MMNRYLLRVEKTSGYLKTVTIILATFFVSSIYFYGVVSKPYWDSRFEKVKNHDGSA